MPELAISESERILLDKIRESPEFFIEEILGDRLDPQQREVCRIFPKARRLSVKSGHACGKDWLTARLALWFHVTHFPSIVVTTGPTDRQVQAIVWGEIRAAYRKARFPIGGLLMPASSMLKSDHPHHYMIGFTANDPSSFQGYHADNVLVIVTEAQAINPNMWPGIDSLMTANNAKLVLIGNAIYEPGSEFYETHTRKAAHYTCLTLDSEKSSHCSKDQINEWREMHGPESAYFRARVKGEFPTDVSDSLIPLGWIERAQARWRASDNVDVWTQGAIGEAHSIGKYVKTLGVDVARFGTDHTVFYEGAGTRFRCVLDRQGQNLMETAGEIAKRIGPDLPAPHVRIDDTGLGGGVTDRLRELGHRVTAINFGNKAKDEDHFSNAKTEMYFNLRERFRLGEIEIDPADGLLVRDLSVIKMKQLSNGQVKIEDKAEQKRKLGYSPDRADALALAVLAQSLALDLETGSIPNRGLLEFFEELSNEKKKEKPVAVRSVLEIPGAAAIIGQQTEGK